MSKLTRILFVIALMLSAIGCSKSFHKVEGTVTMDGQPVEGATVTFIPTFEGGQMGLGTTDASGKFKLINPTNDKGVAKGQYKVLITKTLADDDAPVIDGSDPTKAFAEIMKGKMDLKSGKPVPKKSGPQKQAVNPKYGKQETTPFTITVPADGAITLQLEK